ncbi:unnamed protein product [Closterium sp. Yama58-4]|nr:unnamed protein product [Closterium sp. Yama58-4]
MRLQTPCFTFGLFLVLYASIAEGLRVLDDAAAKLTAPQTPTGIINPGRARNAIHVGSYEGHVEARLRGIEDISGVIRVFVFRNATSVNIRYSLLFTGLSVQGFPTVAGIVTARSNAPVVNFPAKTWSNVTNSPPFDHGWKKQGNAKRMGLLYKYTSSGWCYDAGSVAAEAGMTVADVFRGLMAFPGSYYGTIVAPGGRASGVFAVRPLALKVSHGGGFSS